MYCYRVFLSDFAFSDILISFFVTLLSLCLLYFLLKVAKCFIWKTIGNLTVLDLWKICERLKLYMVTRSIESVGFGFTVNFLDILSLKFLCKVLVSHMFCSEVTYFTDIESFLFKMLFANVQLCQINLKIRSNLTQWWIEKQTCIVFILCPIFVHPFLT